MQGQIMNFSQAVDKPFIHYLSIENSALSLFASKKVPKERAPHETPLSV